MCGPLGYAVGVSVSEGGEVGFQERKVQGERVEYSGGGQKEGE